MSFPYPYHCLEWTSLPGWLCAAAQSLSFLPLQFPRIVTFLRQLPGCCAVTVVPASVVSLVGFGALAA